MYLMYVEVKKLLIHEIALLAIIKWIKVLLSAPSLFKALRHYMSTDLCYVLIMLQTLIHFTCTLYLLSGNSQLSLYFILSEEAIK